MAAYRAASLPEPDEGQDTSEALYRFALDTGFDPSLDQV
jgi:hypothetical protein